MRPRSAGAAAVRAGAGDELPASLGARPRLGSRLASGIGLGLQVELQVAIASGRARTTHVAVSTDAGGGVTSTTLRQVPIRDLVATGVRRLLCQVVPEASEATATIVPVRTWGEAEVSATKQLVGYIDVSGAR